MHLAALVVGLMVCVAAIALGIRFLLAPRQATLAYGVAADNLRAFTEIKGVRDITSGAVLLVVWAAASRTAFGWALMAAALRSSRSGTRSNPSEFGFGRDVPCLCGLERPRKHLARTDLALGVQKS